MMMVAPDDSYSAAEAAVQLNKSERQVQRYLSSGRLRGSKASGSWTVTALQIWQFHGIAEEMLQSWREYCRTFEEFEKAEEKQQPENTGE